MNITDEPMNIISIQSDSSADCQEFDTMIQANISINQSDLMNDFLKKQRYAESVFIWIILIIEVPIVLVTLFALGLLIKSQHAASVFVIQLIFSDLIQIICLILTPVYSKATVDAAHEYSLIAGLYFMACIAVERYILVSHPHWYRTHQSLKSSCSISGIIWFVPLIFAEINPPEMHFRLLSPSIACFIPYPIIILCFVGTWSGLSHSISRTSLKRKMALGSLFLVLLSYTFLILPYSIMSFYLYMASMEILAFKVYRFVICLLYLNPLADCLLYLFMRSDAADIVPSLHCCCRSDTRQISVRYTANTNTHSASSCTAD